VLANPEKLWYWWGLSANPNMTIAEVLANPYLPWNWGGLSSNPSITMTDVEANPEKPWNWRGLSQNPNITVADVLAHPDKPWEWRGVSSNKFGFVSTISYYAGRRKQTQEQMRVFWEELITVVWHPKGKMFQYYLEDRDV
jgi:hypothetical protein